MYHESGIRACRLQWYIKNLRSRDVFDAPLPHSVWRRDERTTTNTLKETAMPTVTTKDGTQIYYKEWGTGQPVVFSHGWPLSSDAWDGQLFFLAQHGYRAIAHDRRGHGRSSQTSENNDM